MRSRLAPLLGALLCVSVPGCLGPGLGGDGGDTGTGSDSETHSTPVSETRLATPDATDGPKVILDGTLAPWGNGFVANLSAYNAGQETYGHHRKFFDSNYQYAWSASLSGPPGDDLQYASPNQSKDSSTHANGAGYTRAPMPPGSYVNWTYGGPWETGECKVLPDCSNSWDGDLTLDGQRMRAPAGTYTWRFTFTYRVPESADQDWSTSSRQEHLDLLVEI